MPCTTMIPSPAAIVNSSLGREPLFSQYRRKKVTRPALKSRTGGTNHRFIFCPWAHRPGLPAGPSDTAAPAPGRRGPGPGSAGPPSSAPPWCWLRVQGPGLQVPDVIAPVVQHTGAWDGVLTVHGAALYLGYAGEAGEDAPARGVPQSPLHIIFFIELPVNVSVFAILTR